MASSINDNIKKHTGLPGNEGLSDWYGRTAGESLNDAERRWLVGNDGVTSDTASNQDMWKELFRKAGLNSNWNYWDAPPVFKLSASELSPIFGAGGTLTRATVATVINHEGVIRSVLSGEVRYQGQRRVYNGYTNTGDSSEDLTTLNNGTKLNATTAATTLELTGTNNAYNYIASVGSYAAGTKVVVRAKVQWISGATTVGFRIFDAASGAVDDANIDLSSGDEKTITLSFTVSSAGVVKFGIDNRSATISGVDTAPTKVIFTELQIQDKTGASDPTIPDSYVSTGVLSSPYHGANVDGVRYFNTTNGNTVASNVVTEAAGSPITGAIGYLGEVARTNKCTNYNANPDSGAVAMGTLAAFNVAGVTNVSASGGDGSSLFGVVADAVKLATAGLDGICTSTYVLHIDNIGSAARAVFNINGAANANAHVLSAQCRGDGSIHLSGRYGASKQTFSSADYARVTNQDTNNTSISSLSVEAGDEAWFILNQLEEGSFATSEIIVEGAAATRNKDELSYSTTNIPVNDCVFSFDWTPTAAGQGLIGLYQSRLDGNNLIKIDHNGTNIALRITIASTTYTVFTALTYAADTTYSIKFRIDSALGKDLWLDNNKATGSSNTTDLVLGSAQWIGSNDGSLTQTGGIANFTIYQGNFSDSEVVDL